MHSHLQQGQTLIEYIEYKSAYELMAATFGIRVKKFHTDNGIFAEESFKSDVSDNNQTIRYCGVGAHFENRITKAAIKQLREKSRTILIHVNHRRPGVIQPYLFLFPLKQA